MEAFHTSNLSYLSDAEKSPSQGGVKAIKALAGAAHCALVLIGQSTFCLRERRALGDIVADSGARGSLRDIEHRRPELAIATDAPGEIFFGRTSEGLTATAADRPMVELSKPLHLLVTSSDPRDADRLRLAEERRELHQAIQLTRFRDAFLLYDSPSCRVRDITLFTLSSGAFPLFLRLTNHAVFGQLSCYVFFVNFRR